MTEEIKRPSIMVGTPMYGGMCTAQYVNGLIKTIAKMQSINVDVYWAHLVNESLITRARNELARICLDRKFDYLMFIDADISFDGEAIATLLAADCDVACGIYPRKEIDWARVEHAAKLGETNLQEFGGTFVFNMLGTEDAETNKTGMIEVRHGGTGFMLIKRHVLEQLKEFVPTYRTGTHKDAEGNYTKPLTYQFFDTSIDATGALLSEDFHFCELWRKHGGKIQANPFIKLEHVGSYAYTGNLIRAGGNLK